MIVSVFTFILASCIAAGVGNFEPQPRVLNVSVTGNQRFPTEGILRLIGTKAGSVYDERIMQKDVAKLYATGFFQTLEVETSSEVAGSVDLVLKVLEEPFVSSFEIEGVPRSVKEQICDFLKKEKLTILPATPYRPEEAKRIAVAIRSFLAERKHPSSEVRVVALRNGSTVRVVLEVCPGPTLDIGKVRFSGNSEITPGELIDQLKITRPATLWRRWSGAGRYTRGDALADAEHLRQYYLAKGHAAVTVGRPEVHAMEFPRSRFLRFPGIGGHYRLEVGIPIVEGPRFTLASMRAEGAAGSAQIAISGILSKLTCPGSYDHSAMERARKAVSEALGRAGYAAARVELEQVLDMGSRFVTAVFKIKPGDPAFVGRINFAGNSRISDKFLRRELLLREGDLYDSSKLDASINKLNRAGIVQAIQRADVALLVDEEDRTVDITIKVREKDRQGVFGTGGTGGVARGYLGLAYSAFNLLGLGEKLSLELDGGAAQSNMILNLVGTRFLGTPFTVALSGVHRLTKVNVANLLPSQSDLIQVLRGRTSGAGLSGSYPLTARISAGLGFGTAREEITRGLSTGAATVQSDSIRSELTPSFSYDSSEGSGNPRGYRLVLAHTWSGPSFLKTVDSTREYAVFKAYPRDPLTRRRNSFAFRLEGMTSLASGGSILPIERRFLPGDELVRGFRRGSLSPWAFGNGGSLQPAGAGMVLGGSAEYRVPIRGPLSGTAFVDLGWSSLDGRSSGSNSGPLMIVEQTNRLFRLSVGGEVRLQLPVLHQPGRLILSWNPLRLDALIPGLSGNVRLSDPRRTLRFALGDVF